jgi:uncharacterized BrkB/YihY/UPF0761 family membrane protein
MIFLFALGISVTASGFLFGFGTASHHLGLEILSELSSVIVNVATFWLTFCILTPKQIGRRKHVWGALVGGIAWTIVASVGSYLVGHSLRHATEVCGFI